MGCGGFAPEGADCSSHGTCIIPADVCICDSGWSGNSDIIGGPLQDCFVNDLAVGILWIPSVVIYFISVVLCIYIRPRIPLSDYPKQFRNSPTFRSLWLSCLCGIFFGANALYKVAHIGQPIPAIGHDIVCTILYCIGCLFFYSTTANNVWLWCVASISTLKIFSADKVQAQLQTLRIGCGIYLICIQILFILPFTIYSYPDKQENIGIAFWVFRGALVIIYQLFERYLGFRLLNVLEECIKFDEKSTAAAKHRSQELIAKLRVKTALFLRQALVASVAVSTLSILAAAWPFFRVQGAYIMSITQFLAGWAGFRLIRTLPRDKSNHAETNESTSEEDSAIRPSRPDKRASSSSKLTRPNGRAPSIQLDGTDRDGTTSAAISTANLVHPEENEADTDDVVAVMPAGAHRASDSTAP